MSYLNSKHDKNLCKRCNAVGKNILTKIRLLVEELEGVLEKEDDEIDDDARCLLKKDQFNPPLITFPDEPSREGEFHIEIENTTPVWELRRYPSRELVAGDLCPCMCSKSNGLTGDCRRRHCRGRAGCFTMPPSCPASRRWAQPVTQQQVNQILSTYSTDTVQACDNHTTWDPSCHLCQYYVTKIDKVVSSMAGA